MAGGGYFLPLPTDFRTIFVGAARSSAAFQSSLKRSMIANSRKTDPSVGSDPAQAWADAWHLWTVTIPRRSITGRLVWGTVWRRRNGGQRWIYKKFVEYSDDGDESQ